MCGIAGIIGIKDQHKASESIRRMTNKISHRGPDADGYFVNEHVALGHRRLSIIDLSEGANQPMHDSSGRYTMIFNGEIYNFKEIKKELADYPFKTHSDTEVILAAYIKWGIDSLQKLNGMFTIAIWDELEKKLFIARDRLGIKPLYFYNDDHHFIFASEVRSLLSTNLIPRKINKKGLVDYLTYQNIHAPHTIIQGVQQLFGGECGTYKNGEFQKLTYWDITEKENGELFNDPKTVKKKVKDHLMAAVERRMISDVPLGAFLSGGIDSSAIVAMMAQISSQAVNTFAIGFTEKEYDESAYADLIAKKYNTNHTLIRLSPNDCLDELPAILKAMDTPSGDGVNTYMVSQATKNAGITVALSGLGGDELFAGYSVFLQYYNLIKKKYVWKTPTAIRSMAASLVGATMGGHKVDRMQQFLKAESFQFENIYPIFRKIMSPKEINNFNVSLPTDYNTLQEFFGKKIKNISQFPLFSQVSIGEISSYTKNVLLKDSDQMSMAHALEIRVPFFDHKLIEYVLQIPDHLKYPNYPKQLLVESLSPLVPDEVVHRKKMGFTFPWAHWLRNELKPFCETRIKRLAQRDIFVEKEILQYWDRFSKGDKQITWIKIWMLVVLEEWFNNNNI